MYKVLLILAALVSTPSSLWAQTSCRVDTIFNYEYVPGTSVKDVVSREINTYNAANQILVHLRENKDLSSNSFVGDFRYNYSYNSKGLQSEVSTYEYASGLWNILSKKFLIYNSAGLLEETVFQAGPAVGVSLRNFRKTHFTYDVNNNLTVVKTENWNSSINSWENDRVDSNTYISNNLLSRKEVHTWNNNAWLKIIIFDRVYNSQNQLSNSLTRVLNMSTSTFQSQTNVNCQYDGNGNRTDSLVQVFDIATNTWENAEKFSLGYNSNNDLVAVLKEVYLLGAWQERSRTINTYDSNTNLTRSLRQGKGAPFGTTWVNSTQEEYEYDQNNFLTAYEQYENWNNSAGYFDDRTRSEYICTALSNIGLVERAPNALSVFPNPLKKGGAGLTVQSPQEGPYVIYNRLGQVVKEGQLKKGANNFEPFVQSSGIYLIKTDSGTFRILITD